MNTSAAKGQLMGKVMAQSKGKPRTPPKTVDIPPKYSDPKTSGLKTTVAKGENKFDIVIAK